MEKWVQSPPPQACLCAALSKADRFQDMKALLFLAPFLNLANLVQGHEHIYQATLTGSNEDTPNLSSGIGTSKVTLDLGLITMRVEIYFSGKELQHV